MTSAAFTRRCRVSKAKTARYAVGCATACGAGCEYKRARRKGALTHPVHHTTNPKSALP
jgi:hypothetical protein